MKKKYYSLIFIFVFCFSFLIACKSYEVSYINERLIIDDCISVKYVKTIYSNDVLLYEEKIESLRNNDVFNQNIKVKELAPLDSELPYIETSEEKNVSFDDLKMNLNLKEEYFNKAQLKISKTSLLGKLKNDMVFEALGISNASNASIDIKLISDDSLISEENDSFRIKNINIYYLDTNSNFKVSICVYYEYDLEN